ncbi:hypothetical protein BLX24_11605 [Arsenicibacter rosenii]|uniref:Uncharacterized protein n=1 Tax=Arsenicibacter rosenii TaxID=1750698 RepID=A0A1S2VM46_9BACT|nr:hypothetical protein BLX24_11605 [Arsenicibacter rosenii]
MLRSVIFSAVIAFVFFIAEYFYGNQFVHPLWKVMLLFYVSLSFLMHRLVDLGNQGKPERFIGFYMTFIIVRLILSVGFVGFFLYRGLDDRKIFILDFLVLYIFYTSFEMYGLNRNLRRDL